MLKGEQLTAQFAPGIKLSTGLLGWLQASLYTVTYTRNGAGVQYVGNRARLTAVAPDSWKLPFAAGLSQEIGYARLGFAENRWAYEITPIFGKETGSVSLLINHESRIRAWAGCRPTVVGAGAASASWLPSKRRELSRSGVLLRSGACVRI